MKLFTILAAAVVVLGLTLAASDVKAMGDFAPKAEKDPDFVAANAALDAKDYRKAIVLLANVIERDPENADAENLTGFAHRMLKDYDMAFKHYARALEIDPKHKGAHEYMGISYLETNQLDKAEELLASLKELCAFCAERRSLDQAVKAYKRDNNMS